MHLDDERESEYVEDRRDEGGDYFGNEDPFEGRRYGGGNYGGGPFGGGGGLGGGLLGGLLGGILGGIMSRPRNEEQQGGGASGGGWGHGGGGPGDGSPYGGQPQNRPGMSLGGKIAVAIALIAALVLLYLLLSPATPPAPVPSPRSQVGQGPMPRMQSALPPARQVNPANDPQAALVTEMKKVLAKTEDTWDVLFQQSGGQYRRPRLVLYNGSTPTACGQGQAAMGPFYCPGDQKVYLDLRFFSEMERRFKAGGDFARAYVIAHEIGHHVQTLTGVMQKTNAMRQRMSKAEYNKVSVRLELQADCYAGVWAHHANRAKPFLDPGDVDEALKAANAIGDDTLQRAARGAVVPDSFTHGTSEQRMRWFKTGFDSGSVSACDTFSKAI
ncbi:MAG: neutral zinc metallopeptidase [Burkholderiaceae bacterium]|nr:neutral zinc metallopeptidase [Burkholderiaceae bacterium]